MSDVLTEERDEALPDEQFRAIARAVADARRFAMLRQIAACDSGLMCSALEVHEEITPATVSHHLKELQEAGLVEVQRAGRLMHMRLRREVWARYLVQLGSL